MTEIELQNLLKTLPNSFDKERLTSLADIQVERYYRTNNTFSISVVNFQIQSDMQLVYNKESIIKFISSCICKVVLTGKESYSFDGTNFIILFADRFRNYTLEKVKKLEKLIFDKYEGNVSLSAGISECPSDGVTFSSLIKTALDNFVKISSIEEKKDWSCEINKSLIKIEGNVKSHLFEELNALIHLINSYDKYLCDHSALVAQGSILLAKEMGLSWLDVEKIAIAALLHDIGYTAIPKEIFNKKGKLSLEDRKFIQMHPTIACEHILKNIPMLEEYLPLIQNHHEYLDGSGYPKRRKGDQVSIGSQIISIVDSYHAMKTDRPYRNALSFEKIIDFYIQNAGIKWEEEIITMFVAIIADDESNNKLMERESIDLNSLFNRE